MALRHDDSTVNIVIGIIIIFLTPVLNCQGMKKIMLLLLLLLFYITPIRIWDQRINMKSVEISAV